MATQWGNNSLAPGGAAGWYFVRPNVKGRLTVLSVMPLSPSFTDGQWSMFGSDGLPVGFPYENQLGISTQWVQLSDDLSHIIYYLVVMNYSNSTIEYAFLEADL
jgi:hypothetical protein